ncbi:ATP-binding response regulator [Nocardioides dongxiaopingii]|uniref:ATP-binding response regulator n=1 Tax=Nocardioides dongxiaopingii TaxID=2576036 RepID=UPI0010C76766|nr:hybrid sensor histidine kinase/response regulator [Nocardioides dongxiaopingii]
MLESVPATMTARPSADERRVRTFRVVAVATVVVCAVFVALLQPSLFPADVRQSASGLALVLSGLFLAVSCGRGARMNEGRRRRSWQLIQVGAVVAVTGNVWSAAAGSDPVTSPSTVSDLTITVALVLCIAAVLTFPSAPRRRADQVVMLLDGLVVGGAVLIVASTLVYSELLDETRGNATARFTTLLIPVLDVVLIVAALLLLLRTRGADRRALALLTLGFLSYALADLSFAVLVAQGDFEFGTPVDLGWIIGYALLSLAAWCPPTQTPESGGPGGAGDLPVPVSADVRDAAMVYLGLMVAAAVQVLAGSGHELAASTAVLWLTMAFGAAVRQIVLTRDNLTLRRGLERRVRDQTADLRRLARQTEVLLTSVGDGIYGVDAEGRVTFVNPSGAEALTHTAESLHGANAHDLFHAPDDDGLPHPYDGCYIAEAIRSGVVTTSEEDVYLRADGSSFPVEITASPLVEDHVVRGAVVVFRDVTQRREVDRIKNEFISVVSHELRTPLTSIRGSLGLLVSGKLGELTPKAGAMANLALESSERLTRLINDILDLERIESGTRPLDVAPTDAADLLARSVAEMTGQARATGVRLEVGPSTGRVLADGDRVVQTLANLLNNAIKYSSAGQSVVLSSADDGAGAVLFSVRDEGRGIPSDRLEAVFQRFEQADSSDARLMGGTGLGLTISRGIVERHGGRIWAESVVGAGTTLFFTLPSAGRSGSRSGSTPDGRPGDRGGVLLVEDDDDLSDVLTTLLAGHGVPVARATGVQEALAMAARNTPRLLILDVALPDGTGHDLVAGLALDPRTADLDVIVYSAADVEPHDRPRLTLGRTSFVTKSRVDPTAVEDRVLELLATPPVLPGRGIRT